MMAAQYAGLCIGGPMAGQSTVQPYRQFRCEEQERKPLLAALKESIENPDATTTVHTYVWQHIGPFALWIHESLNLNTALETMAGAYMEKCQHGGR